MADTLTPQVRGWRNAVFVVFAVAGAGFATWASRIPAARDELHLDTGKVAVLLVGISVGSIAGLVLAPALIRRTSGRRRRLPVPERLRDLRLLVIGVMVTGMALTEGAANDWIALAAVDGHGASETGGALVFGAFVVGMTAARVVGGPLLDRYGRAPVLAGTAAVGLVGIVLFILVPSGPPVYVAAVLWGIGGSMGFPVGMSAAADHPTDGPRRVSIIGVFGYGSFLLGPPVIGFLAEHVGLLDAFYLVAALLLVSLACARSARPSTPEPGPVDPARGPDSRTSANGA